MEIDLENLPKTQKQNEGELNEKYEDPAKSHRGLKRRRSSISPDQSGSIESLPPSPNASLIDRVHFDAEEEMDPIKYELMDENVEAGPLTCTETTTGEEDMIEEIKIEQQENDPLMLGGSNATIADEETLPTNEKCCDEGYFPGTDDNLPQIDALTVAEFFAAFPAHIKKKIRGIWQQPREHLNDSIGYVQIKKENVIRIIKCVVATKTSANNCTITYNVARNCIIELICDCNKSLCHHGISALTWLCNREAGPGTYWMQPMITIDAKSLRISEIFGFKRLHQKNIVKMEQNLNAVMDDFIKTCQKKNILKPVMTYVHQDLKDESSLRKLMSKFKLGCNKMDAKHFLDFCHENLNEGLVVKFDKTSVEERRELIFGRITDDLLHDVCLQTDAEDIVDKIIFPDVQDEVEVNTDVIESIEKSLKMKINKCGLFLLPVFAASPYGTTETHVIHIDQSNESILCAENKITPKQNVCLQLQMYLARRDKACLCVLRENRVDVIMVKLNKVRVKEMLKKAKLFWQKRIFKQIMDD